MEKVSVIIPVYNAEAYIAETLLSVHNQTWKNIEIIVVNDGSKDGSEAIINDLNLPNLKLFNRPNQGQCAASNYGLSQATGTLIKFLDADDILGLDCVERMVLKWRECPERLVFGEWHYFVNNLNHVLVNECRVYKDYDNALDWYVDVLNYAGSMLAGWMWLIPKAILDKAGGWDERLHLMNDFEFSTRLVINSAGIGFAEGAKHFYRKGLPSSMTSSMNDRIALSIYTGVKEAYSSIMLIENTERTRLAFANQFQKWVYQFHPLHKDLVNKMELLIDELGGSTLQPTGGSAYKLLCKIMPWKWVSVLQHNLHNSIWKPILSIKRKSILNRQFNLSSGNSE